MCVSREFAGIELPGRISFVAEREREKEEPAGVCGESRAPAWG